MPRQDRSRFCGSAFPGRIETRQLTVASCVCNQLKESANSGHRGTDCAKHNRARRKRSPERRDVRCARLFAKEKYPNYGSGQNNHNQAFQYGKILRCHRGRNRIALQ
mgnify:CR=1 FL=1